MPKPRITYEEAKRLLSYNPDTGDLIWKVDRNTEILAGQHAGCADSKGYIILKLCQKNYSAHRIIWLLMYGNFPVNHIDHINGNPSDNRRCNLREATPSQNGGNRKISKNNKSGYKGVYWHKRAKKWSTHIRYQGNTIHIGNFDTKEEAAKEHNKTALKYFGEYANVTEISSVDNG